MPMIGTNPAFDKIQLSSKQCHALMTTRLRPYFTAQHTLQENQQASEFNDFNLGLHVGDNPQSVLYHRKCLTHFLPQGYQIQWLEQVHSNKVVVINQAQSNTIVADSQITRRQGVVLAIMTADCLPVVLADIQGKEIAVVHCGWRGLAANILEKTIKKMVSPINQVEAYLGACIQQPHFEVGADVKFTFCQNNPNFNSCFSDVSAHQFLANLQKIASIQLSSLGVENITVNRNCTYAMTNRYYSYRRNHVTGRMATLAWLS